ncbi:MAG: hypothetical protein OEY00_10365 [Gammaproteobacteria bacterium]|nr:hypothetical protein [Gammaproteobacteria bacterium]
MKTSTILSTVLFVGMTLGLNAAATAEDRTTGRGTGPVIYVTSQGLYYDSIVLADVPPNGPFQQLVPGPNGLSTDFGPGEVGHKGGRWWLDLNGDGVMNDGDKFFLCPLLGPGRTAM